MQWPTLYDLLFVPELQQQPEANIKQWWKGKQMTQKEKEVYYGISVMIWLHNIDQMAIAPFSAGGFSMSCGL